MFSHKCNGWHKDGSCICGECCMSTHIKCSTNPLGNHEEDYEVLERSIKPQIISWRLKHYFVWLL